MTGHVMVSRLGRGTQVVAVLPAGRGVSATVPPPPGLFHDRASREAAFLG